MLHMEYTKVMEINVRYDTIRYTIYMWHTGRKRFGISSVLSGLSVPFRCVCVREEMYGTELPKMIDCILY